jgi:membrane associated rhomboid family serine protease
LWLFGATIEDRFGRVRLLVIYAAGAAAALAVDRALTPERLAVPLGAGGAVAAVAGAYLTRFGRSQVLTYVPLTRERLVEVPATFFVALFLLFHVVHHASGRWSGRIWAVRGVGPEGLIAGLAAGAALGVVLARRERLSATWRAETSSRPKASGLGLRPKA